MKIKWGKFIGGEKCGQLDNGMGADADWYRRGKYVYRITTCFPNMDQRIERMEAQGLTDEEILDYRRGSHILTDRGWKYYAEPCKVQKFHS